jgi:hypothetical protein
MDAQLKPLPARTQYRFALIGLSANDARLFSSLFRLLSDRMRHLWLPVAAHETRAMTLVGDAVNEEELKVARTQGGILRIGNQQQDRENSLCFPLRPTEIMRLFDRVGESLDREIAGSVVPSLPATASQLATILHAANAPASVRAALSAMPDITMSIGADGRVVSTTPASPLLTPTHDANPSALSSTTRIKLLRWPTQQLLRESSAHLTLATLMVYRITTIEELQARSELPANVCQLFVARVLADGHAMRDDSLVRDASQTKRNPAVDARTPHLVASSSTMIAQEKRRGVIAFIRRRLSI